MPDARHYSIALHQKQPLPNDLVVYLMRDGSGEERIHKTGLLTGWRVHFVRANCGDAVPEDIAQTVMQFTPTKGA